VAALRPAGLGSADMARITYAHTPLRLVKRQSAMVH
jgi:hypothetical protein